MRILLDTRPGSNSTGIGRYSRTLSRLLRGTPGSHEVFTLGSDSDVAPRAADPNEDLLELPAVLARESIDLYHSPLGFVPAGLPCRSIVTIHDVIPLLHPSLVPATFHQFFESWLAALADADAIVCPSACSMRDLVQAVGVDPHRVRVVSECVDPAFRVATPEAVADARTRHGLPEAHLLVVGTLERRKGPDVVLDALALEPALPPVAFVGPDGGFQLEAEAAKRGVADRVRRLGRVDDRDLAALYGGARALLFPSRYEGFGLPALEAIHCGCPVVAARAGALPEVLGDGAALVPVEDAAALARATLEILPDGTARDSLLVRARARLAHFSPERCREEFCALYDDLASTLAECHA